MSLPFVLDQSFDPIPLVSRRYSNWLDPVHTRMMNDYLLLPDGESLCLSSSSLLLLQ